MEKLSATHFSRLQWQTKLMLITGFLVWMYQNMYLEEENDFVVGDDINSSRLQKLTAHYLSNSKIYADRPIGQHNLKKIKQFLVNCFGRFTLHSLWAIAGIWLPSAILMSKPIGGTSMNVLEIYICLVYFLLLMLFRLPERTATQYVSANAHPWTCSRADVHHLCNGKWCEKIKKAYP